MRISRMYVVLELLANAHPTIMANDCGVSPTDLLTMAVQRFVNDLDIVFHEAFGIAIKEFVS